MEICRIKTETIRVKDTAYSGRLVTDKVVTIAEKVEQHRHISSYDISVKLGTNHRTALTHLKKSGYIKRLHICLPLGAT